VAQNFDIVARLIADIAHMTISLKAPNYREMLEMDEKVRRLWDRCRSTTPAVIPIPLICTLTRYLIIVGFGAHVAFPSAHLSASCFLRACARSGY
jgi:hypothetical protein